MATCNVRATNPARSCRSSQDIVNEAIHAFFINTKCGQLEFCSLNSQPKLKATLALAVGAAYLNFNLTWYKTHETPLICTGSLNFTKSKCIKWFNDKKASTAKMKSHSVLAHLNGICVLIPLFLVKDNNKR